MEQKEIPKQEAYTKKQGFWHEKVVKLTFLFFLGGMLYYYTEIFFRGYSHYSMIICGGLSFVIIGLLNQSPQSDFSILSQMVMGSLIITALEFLTGLIVNRWLHLHVWDYSLQPYNILGQICLAYSNLWFLLSLVVILLDDLVRSLVFDEPKKQYRIL